MTYRLKTIADGASLFYPMDETSGTVITNYGVNNVIGTYTTPVLNRPPVAARSFRSLGLNSGNYRIPLTTILSSGNENNSFSVEFWFRANSTPGTVGLFANGTQGVFVTSNRIEFRVSFSGGLQTVGFEVEDWYRNYHVVATYTVNQLLLYVNGDLVNSLDVPTGETFSASPTTWGNLSAAPIDIEGLAIWFPTVSEIQIRQHYQTGTDYIPLEIIFGLDGAQTFAFTDLLTNIDYQESFPQNGEWPGLLTNLYVSDGKLIPLDDTSGTWTHPVPLDAFGTIDGSRLDWYGLANTTFDVSLDLGVTWTPATNHTVIPGLIPGFDCTGKVLLVRATLDGQTDPTPQPNLYGVNIIIYEERSQKGWDSKRFATISGDVDIQRVMTHPQHRSAELGATLRNGSVVIETDPDTPVSVFAVEAWVRRNSATAGYILDTRSTGATGRGFLQWTGSAITSTGWLRTYINGSNIAPSAANMPQGEYVHFIGVLSASTTEPIYLNRVYNGTTYGTNDIAYLTLHSTQLSDTQAAARYAAFTGGVRLTVADAISVSVDEDVEPLLLYSEAWSITGAG